GMSGVRKATLFRPALGHVKLLSAIGTVAKDVREQEIKWLWWPLIPMGGLTILTSNGGVGKGLMVSDLVSRITRGDTWPMTDERASIGNVIWAEAEDPADS